jgi:hypothetical protein
MKKKLQTAIATLRRRRSCCCCCCSCSYCYSHLHASGKQQQQHRLLLSFSSSSSPCNSATDTTTTTFSSSPASGHPTPTISPTLKVFTSEPTSVASPTLSCLNNQRKNIYPIDSPPIWWSELLSFTREKINMLIRVHELQQREDPSVDQSSWTSTEEELVPDAHHLCKNVKGAKWPEESFAAHALTSSVAGAIIFLSFLPSLREQNHASNL